MNFKINNFLLIKENQTTQVNEFSPFLLGSLMTQMIKNLPAMQETRVQSLGLEDPLEKGMATHLSILICEIPRTTVGHDWATNAHVWEDVRVWAHWDHSFDLHPNCLEPASCSFPSWIPSGSIVRVTAVSDGLVVITSFAYWFGRQHSSWMPSIRKHLLSIFMLSYTGKWSCSVVSNSLRPHGL